MEYAEFSMKDLEDTVGVFKNIISDLPTIITGKEGVIKYRLAIARGLLEITDRDVDGREMKLDIMRKEYEQDLEEGFYMISSSLSSEGADMFGVSFLGKFIV